MVFICVYVYHRWRGNDILDDHLIVKIGLFLSAPLLLVLIPFVFIPEGKSKIKESIREREEKLKEKELKAKLGLRPDEKYLCFSRMSGVGMIECGDCGYKEKITSFTHGFDSCDIGRQCPNCHAFVVECNESEEYHSFGEAKKDFVCRYCGTIIRKKEESIFKGNDDPLFCPKCHSARLHYHLIYLT